MIIRKVWRWPKRSENGYFLVHIPIDPFYWQSPPRTIFTNAKTFSCVGALSSDERHFHAGDNDRMLIYENSQETGPMAHAAPTLSPLLFIIVFTLFAAQDGPTYSFFPNFAQTSVSSDFSHLLKFEIQKQPNDMKMKNSGSRTCYPNRRQCDERKERNGLVLRLLRKWYCFRLAFQIASHLLDHGALVDEEDNDHQTLLSHLVASSRPSWLDCCLMPATQGR